MRQQIQKQDRHIKCQLGCKGRIVVALKQCVLLEEGSLLSQSHLVPEGAANHPDEVPFSNSTIQRGHFSLNASLKGMMWVNSGPTQNWGDLDPRVKQIYKK